MTLAVVRRLCMAAAARRRGFVIKVILDLPDELTLIRQVVKP
jgi:hypothetical protein